RGALLAGSRDLATDRSRLRARVEVYPRGSRLPDDLVERLLVVLGTQRWRLACVDAGPTCAVILIDLDGDGQEEAVGLASTETVVYARVAGAWVRVGQLVSGRYPSADGLRKALAEGRWRAASPGRYHGLELGTSTYVFVPSECDPGDLTCS